MNKNKNKNEEQLVQVSIGQVILEGNLNIPKKPKGIVLFAHGSGSSRHSPRNKYVA
jgi:putative phosphoribosyl transferase